MIKVNEIQGWLDDRLSVGTLREIAEHKTVPVHRATVFYYFGGMSLFFFIVQVVTGILLMLYYRPSANEAFESIEFIMTTVPFGWLIRSVHSWSANLMVYFAFVHMMSVYFMKAYRPPREITWVTGTLLLFLLMGFGFSGYLLPWNQLAYFATKVGTDIAGSTPVIGEWMLRFLRGGDRVTGGTLSRFYGWHVAILPAVTTAVLGVHLLLVQLQGMSVPPALAKAKGRVMKFFPNFALRDLFGWIVALGVLATLAAVFPWELGEKADPFVPAYKDIRPEWYFMFLFETLKLVPGGELHVFGIPVEYEFIPIALSGVGALLMILVPFLDRGVVKKERSPIFTWIGIAFLAYAVGFTAYGYRSWLPILIILGTAALAALLAFATRETESEHERSLEGGDQ
jgi:cytochrome b6